MKNLFALIGAATVTFLGLGWYLGWYEIESLPSPNGRQKLSVDINSKKILQDGKEGVEKVGEIVEHLRNKGNNEKPDPLPTPPGPAENFFSPPDSRPKESGAGSGWRPFSK